jgi:hypothetical protein
MKAKEPESALQTMSLEQFWSWVQKHPNCIVRVSREDMVLFDHEDHHWYLGVDTEAGLLFVQTLRGKHVIGEFGIRSQDVVYVECLPPEEDEWAFQLHGDDQEVRYLFVMAHPYEDQHPVSMSQLN